QLPRKPWPRRSTSCTSTAIVAGAILVNAPTLGQWYLVQGPAIAISRTTGINALLVSGLSRHKDQGVEIGVTRIECPRTRQQQEREKRGDDDKRPLATIHGPASQGLKARRFWSDGAVRIEVQHSSIRNSFNSFNSFLPRVMSEQGSKTVPAVPK